eukprot:COSAG01_NODE_45887_length_405_cov_0.970588_1_plen_97_part_10
MLCCGCGCVVVRCTPHPSINFLPDRGVCCCPIYHVMISRRRVQRETEAALAHRGHQMRGVVQELVGRLGQLEDQNRELSRALGRLRSQAAAAAGDRG